MITASLYAETLAFCYLLIKLAHPSLILPAEVAVRLAGYKQEESMRIAYQAYRKLFLSEG